MTTMPNRSGHRLPDLATTVQQPAAVDALIRLRKLGADFNGALLAIEDAKLIGLEPDHAVAERPAKSIPWRPLPEAIYAAVAAWDRAAATTGLNVVACEVLVVARRCWQPPALMLPATVLADLLAETTRIIDEHGRGQAWARLPWRLAATISSFQVCPLEHPRSAREKALFDALGPVWHSHLSPWRAWFAALGSLSIVQLPARAAL